MFYVNDDPEGKFLYTETIKLYLYETKNTIHITNFRSKKKKKSSTGGVRTHADINPLDLKSNALTTRPPYLATSEDGPKYYNVLKQNTLSK